MAASRVIVGIVAGSVAEVDDQVTPAQMRILVLVARQPGLNLTALAELLGVHASNATRACDRLVRAGLLSRNDSEADRRQLELTLTGDGTALLRRLMDHRRRSFEQVLERMTREERASLSHALTAFASAAGEPLDDGTWPA